MIGGFVRYVIIIRCPFGLDIYEKDGAMAGLADDNDYGPSSYFRLTYGEVFWAFIVLLLSILSSTRCLLASKANICNSIVRSVVY